MKASKIVALAIVGLFILSGIVLLIPNHQDKYIRTHIEITYPFADTYYPAVFGPSGIAEVTTLSSAAQMDIWNQGYYWNTTDGITYSTRVPTTTASGMTRPYVLEIGGTYYMFASNESTGANGSFYLFTSTDKIHFVEQGLVLWPGSGTSWDNSHLGNLCVWVEGPTWYMLYEAHGTSWRIGLATSLDGIVWTKDVANPVLNEDPLQGGSGRPIIARVNSTVLKYGGEYYLYYHQQTAVPGAYGLGVLRAHSSDLKNWTKEGQVKSIIPAGPPFINNGDQSLVEFQGKTYLYYSPTDQITISRTDVVIDNRNLSDILALPPGDPPPVTNVWNQTSGNLASTAANWVNKFNSSDHHVPLDNEAIFFDWHSTANCTWDLAGSYLSFTVDATYASGVITFTSSFNMTSFYQGGGTVIGNATKTLTTSEGFISHATMTAEKINLIMTGNSTLDTSMQLLLSLTINHSNTIIVIGWSSVHGDLTIGSGSNLSIYQGMVFAWRTYGSGTLANFGNISGQGTFQINVFGGTPAVNMHTGNISSALMLKYVEAVGANVVITADGPWSCGNFSFTNPSTIYTVTLNLGGYDLTCSGDWNSTSGIFIQGSGNLNMITAKSGSVMADWTANATGNIIFTIPNTTPGTTYRLYIDGIQISNIAPSGTSISFSYSGPWNEHEFKVIVGNAYGANINLVLLIPLFLALGVAIKPIMFVAKTAKAEKPPSLPDIINMAIFTIVGLSLVGMFALMI